MYRLNGLSNKSIQDLKDLLHKTSTSLKMSRIS